MLVIWKYRRKHVIKKCQKQVKKALFGTFGTLLRSECTYTVRKVPVQFNEKLGTGFTEVAGLVRKSEEKCQKRGLFYDFFWKNGNKV